MSLTLVTLTYFFSILWYYIRCGVLTPIAYLGNRSFLLHHPNRIFPTTIAPSRNTTIHSLVPTRDMFNYITQHCALPPPPLRRWRNPSKITTLLPQTPPLRRAIILDGEITGPSLRQGMIFIQNHNIIYIQEEFGRWPTRDDYIVTSAVSLSLNNTFRLFLPVHQVDRYGLLDNSPLSPFNNPLPLTQVIQESRRLKNAIPPPPTEV